MRFSLKNWLYFSVCSLFFLATPSLAEQEPLAYPQTILVVDLNNDGKATYEDFLNGKDGILLFEEKPANIKESIMQSEAFLTKVFEEYTAVSQASLQKQGKNQDGIIDANNPIYKNLRIAFIDNQQKPGERLVIVSLKKADIEKITLDGKYKSLSPAERQKKDYLAGTAILKGGEHRAIYDVARQ
jgi:hypothetical protein